MLDSNDSGSSLVDNTSGHMRSSPIVQHMQELQYDRDSKHGSPHGSSHGGSPLQAGSSPSFEKKGKRSPGSKRLLSKPSSPITKIKMKSPGAAAIQEVKSPGKSPLGKSQGHDSPAVISPLGGRQGGDMLDKSEENNYRSVNSRSHSIDRSIDQSIHSEYSESIQVPAVQAYTGKLKGLICIPYLIIAIHLKRLSC